jgi:DNA-directed RNA polymerase subunit F
MIKKSYEKFMSNDPDKLHETRQSLSFINDKIDELTNKIQSNKPNESKEFTQTIFESE